jgi:tetraacyldisaccharide 4'-kinase
MLASLLDRVAVWAGPDRRATLEACLVDSPEVIVVDDGLSLGGVRKDLEIALLSAGQSCFRRIPAGPMRRPVTDTARADVVGIHAGGEGEALEEEARRLLSVAGATSHPWFAFRLRPVRDPDPGLAYLAAGIGRPDRFEASAREAGFQVVGKTWYPDHHAPAPADLIELERDAAAAGADCLLVTAKDAPRFPVMLGPLPVRVLEVEVEVVAHETVLESALERALVQAGRS